MGQLAQRLNHPWEESLGWYLRAYTHSKRVEPLISIAEYYMNKDSFGRNQPDWHLAYTFIAQACRINFPHHQILFIDKNAYVYKRWHLMGRIGFYANRFKEGKEGCIRALMAQETQVDMNNLLIYLKKEKEMATMIQSMNGIQQMHPQNVDPMMSISMDGLQDDLLPAAEKGLGIGNAFTKEEVLRKAMMLLR
jgi:hypothetical protein